MSGSLAGHGGLHAQLELLRRTVVEDLMRQLREGRLDLSELKGIHEAEIWFVQNKSSLNESVAFGFESLLRKTVRELNALNDFAREALSLPEATRPSNEQFQRRVEQLQNAFLESATTLINTAEKETPSVANYQITVSEVVGPVNLFSSLNGAVQSVTTPPALSAKQQDDLADLLRRLKSGLAVPPPGKEEEAGYLAEQAEALAKELSRPTPRRSALKISASGLVEAANALKDTLPIAFDIAKDITSVLGGV